jgi:hypothetical protein
MALKQLIEIYELLDNAKVDGEGVARFLESRGVGAVEVLPIEGYRGCTDSIKITIPGTAGKRSGGSSPTIGVIGRLGGIGARPEMIGLVSDADGAIASLAVALKLADMGNRGDALPGDVIIATHICPNAPTTLHDRVPFMTSPVDTQGLNAHQVDTEMAAILSIDTTKGNRIINQRGFAISPTVKEGYILKVSQDLLTLMEITTGKRPSVLAITTQDITPYGNGLHHLNSLMQPCVGTLSPVVGVALTVETVVPGSATGASHIMDIEEAVRFIIEVAKQFGAGRCAFYDDEEFQRITRLYGSMRHLQTLGGKG